MTTFQSRWGFHPCSPETYRKLKRLNFLAWEARRRFAAWERWNRKQPQNRRVHIGGTDGWTGGKLRDIPKMHRVYAPVPEPLCPPIDPNAYTITDDYLKARTPVVETQVRPLSLSEQKIDDLLKTMEEWYAAENAVEMSK